MSDSEEYSSEEVKHSILHGTGEGYKKCSQFRDKSFQKKSFLLQINSTLEGHLGPRLFLLVFSLKKF